MMSTHPQPRQLQSTIAECRGRVSGSALLSAEAALAAKCELLTLMADTALTTAPAQRSSLQAILRTAREYAAGDRLA